jgi:hypothetical protein
LFEQSLIPGFAVGAQRIGVPLNIPAGNGQLIHFDGSCSHFR